jgi:hypothetical protein
VKKSEVALALGVPFAIVFIAKTLATFAAIIQGYLRIHYDLWFELGMVIGQVLFQWVVLYKRSWRERIRYAFVLIFVSLLGATLLWPMLGYHLRVATLSPLIATGWFFGVVGVMFAVHWWLVKRENLPVILCATWVVYRLLILAYALKI